MHKLKTTSVLIIAIYSSLSQAGPLCDSQCTLSIDFPSGGSIEAVEPLEIIFGDSGLVETPGTVTAYLEGDTLFLNSGESLDFDNGGHFNIGASGNISFSSLTITTDGVINLTAIGEGATVNIPAGSHLTINAGELTVGPSIIVDGVLNIGDNVTFDITGDGISAGCSISNSTGSTLTVGGVSQPIMDNTTTCQTLTSEISLVGEVSGVINSNPATVELTGSLELNTPEEGAISLDTGSLTPAQENGSSQSNAGALDTRLLVFYLLVFCLRMFAKSHKK